jgi:hypothetical protein
VVPARQEIELDISPALQVLQASFALELLVEGLVTGEGKQELLVGLLESIERLRVQHEGCHRPLVS